MGPGDKIPLLRSVATAAGSASVPAQVVDLVAISPPMRVSCRARSAQASWLGPRQHMSVFVKPEPGALAFPGVMGGPLRRGNFNKMAGWPEAVASTGETGFHFHDLRHTGNSSSTASGAGLRDLMARMGHDGGTAMIYQHEARGADQAITSAIDAHVDAERRRGGDDDDGLAGALVSAR
jgi:integrase